jgi:hypothetical protein
MKTLIHLDILPQPDDFTCGPTCLQAVYRYFQDEVPLERVIGEVSNLDEGGTLGVLLGCHALKRGYQVTIYTYNLQVFDPTWFAPGGPDLRERLRAQARAKVSPKLQLATRAYLDFLERGGQLQLEDLTQGLIRKYLDRSIPILTGLSSTYLYRCARERNPETEYDDIRGEPAGHFVVLCGYDGKERSVQIADPFQRNPVSGSRQYAVNIDRVIGAILLGIITYDANLLIIEPGKASAKERHADVRGRQ